MTRIATTIRIRALRTLTFASTLALALATLGGGARANHDLLRHVSAGEINGNGAFGVIFQGNSADGSRAFFTTSEPLVSADTDAATDVYERSGGTTTRISAGQINGNGAHGAAFRGTSDDGTRVFFVTPEQLVSADTDAAPDVYERSGGSTKLVSAGQINGNGELGAGFVRTSDDGSRVFFITFEPLVPSDTDTAQDIYQRAGGTTKRISAGQVNGNGAQPAAFTGASDDGSRVFFITNEQLVPSDTDTVHDVYERSAGTTKLVSAGQINGNGAFVAVFKGASDDGTRVFFATAERLASVDKDSADDVYERSGGTTTRISSGNGNFSASFRSASANGSRVFFDTYEQLVGADADSDVDLYERSGGTTRRISAGQVNGNDAFEADFEGSSEDGTRVFFRTGEQLVSADTDGAQDVYERSGGSTKLISAGEVNGNGDTNASFERASDDGTRVFFNTREPLVSADADNYNDVYERAAGTTARISPGNGAFDAFLAGVSEDGSAVFFVTNEKVVASDEDSSIDVYGAYISP